MRTKQKTRNSYERHLSEQYGEMDDEKVFESLEYVLSPSREPKCSKKALQRAIQTQSVGHVVRKYDPIAFEVGYGEWTR